MAHRLLTQGGTMRFLPYVLLAALPITAACVSEDEDVTDLGSIADGKNDAPEVRDVPVTVNKASANPGVRNYSVRSTVEFEVSLAYEGDQNAKLIVTNQETSARFESDL